MDLEQARATGHIVAAVTALVSGAAVLVSTKGTRAHKVMGASYVVALLLVDVAALSLHRENAFGVFHLMALLSLASIAVGMVPLLLGRRSPAIIATHAFTMSWSYAGLVAAGCGQLGAAIGQDTPWMVPLAIGSALTICGVLIFARVPPILGRKLDHDPARLASN